MPAIAQTYFECVSGTGENATVIIPLAIEPTAGGEPLAEGDEIAVFTPVGLCAGVVRWENWNTAITVWGNNTITAEVDGFRAGEEMLFRVFQKETGIVFSNVTVTYAMGEPVYTPDGLYRLSALDAYAGHDPPELESPADGETGVSLSPKLQWKPVDGVDEYRLQISGSVAFVPAFSVDVPAGTTQHTITGANEGATFFWRVRSVGGDGAGAWSPARSFTTATATVSASASALSIPSTSAGRMRTAGVDVTNAAASTATVEVAAGPLSQPFSIEQETASSLSPGSSSRVVIAFSPEAAGTYRDTLRITYSHHGLERHLSVPVEAEASGPAEPGESIFLLYPVDGVVDVDPSDVLRWSSLPDKTYDVQVAEAHDFSRAVIDREQVADTVLALSGLAHFVEYSWRVRPSAGEWTAPSAFRTTLAVPAVISPAAESTVDTNAVTFSWHRVRGAQQFDFRLSPVRSGVYDVIMERTTDSTLVISDLPPGEEFSWAVRAVSGSSTGEWTPEVLFSTGSTLPSEPGEEPELNRLTALYPNPTTGYLTFSYRVAAAAPLRLEIWDAAGRRVWTESRPEPSPGAYSDQLALHYLAAGPYWLRLVSDGSTSTRAFIRLD